MCRATGVAKKYCDKTTPGLILGDATFWRLTSTLMFSSTLYKALLCLSPSATEMERLDSVVLFELLQMSLLRILSHSHL